MASFSFNRTVNTKNGKRERITVSSAVKQLTAATYTISGTDGNWEGSKRPDRVASGAIIQVNANSMYYSLDGTDPSATVGFSVAAGDYITLDSPQQVREFKIIRQSADGTIEVLYLWGS